MKQILNKMDESDFTEAKLGKKSLLDAKEISFEDKKLLEIVDNQTELVDTHYQVPLSFRNPNVKFHSNQHYAKTR